MQTNDFMKKANWREGTLCKAEGCASDSDKAESCASVSDKAKLCTPVSDKAKLRTAVFWGMSGLLVFAPLAFGSVHVWAYSLLETGIFLLLAIFFVDRLLFSAASEMRWVRTPVNLSLLLLFCFILLQMTPLPPSWVSLVSPRMLADKLAISGLAGEAEARFRLAYYLHPAIRECLKLAAYAGMFFLVVNVADSKRKINTLIFLLIMTGLFEALYAIWQTFDDTPMIWWWKSRVGNVRYTSGTFVGSNHFAFYMEMLLPLTLGFAVTLRRPRKRLVTGMRGIRASFHRVIALLSPESAHPKMFLLLSVAALMGLALVFSASRGGILSAVLAMTFMSVLFFGKRKYRKYGILASGFCLFVLMYALFIGMGPTIKKFEKVYGLERRLVTSRSLVPMISDYSLGGVGWGNFRHLWPRYVPKEYDGVSSSGYSHNDWLEAGTELGLPGLVIIAFAFFAYLFRMIGMWRKRRDRYAVGVGAGVMAALVSVGCHSFFDFSMHIPANPLTLAALMGVGYAAVHRKRNRYGEFFSYRVRSISLTTARRVAGVCLILPLFSLGVFMSGRHFLAEIHCPSEWNSTLNLNWDPYMTDIRKAIDLNPHNAEYHFKLAEHYMSIGISDKRLREEYNDRAIESLREAVRLNPADATYWYRLGERYYFRRNDSYDYLSRWLGFADRCFDMARKCAPNDADMLFRLGHYWVWRSSLSSDIREDGVARFRQIFRHALDINPKKWEWVAEKVWEHHPEDALVFDIMPEDNEELKSLVLAWLAKQGG